MRSTLSIFVFVIWYLKAEVNGTYRAFVFNRSKSTIVKFPNDLSNINCDAWMTSCPAEDDDERDFENEYSLYNKALFVQNVYFSNKECTDLDKAVCNKPIETSMTFSYHNKKYEFGYEMFHEISKLPDISHLPFDTYYPMKKFRKEEAILGDLFSKKTYTEMQERKEVKLKLRGADTEFNWVPLVKVKLDSALFRNVEYEIHKNNTNPMLQCQDYSLGNEIMDSVAVDSLYENQKKIFKRVALPTRKNKSDENPEGSCTQEYECLTKWPLLPTDQFQFGSDSPLKCSNVTTVPIWKSTLEGIMRKLDQYLYALSRISGQPLRVLAGVHQVLALHSSDTAFITEKVLENEKLKIEIPRIIYKMIKFRLNPCEGNNCWYGILILIHNGPYFNKRHLVCEDQSRDLGWEEIRYETWSNEGAYSKFIYVCKISKLTMASVGLTNTPDTHHVQPLSLLKFPLLDEDEELMFRSIKGKVFDELKRLSEPGEKVELEDILIERPAIYYNFGSRNEEDFVYEDDDE